MAIQMRVISLLLTVLIVLGTSHNQNKQLFDGSACNIVGCQICFDPTVCLLCDTSKYFEEEPENNACKCQPNRWLRA